MVSGVEWEKIGFLDIQHEVAIYGENDIAVEDELLDVAKRKGLEFTWHRSA